MRDMRCRPAPYALLLASFLTAASSQANDTVTPAESARVAPVQPSWPVDCTRDVQRDGLVLIDPALGNVKVSLRPSSENSDIAGCFGPDQDGVRVWKSKEPLRAQTEYRLEVQPLDAVGAPVGEALLSHFTTGDELRQPLSFGALPTTRVLPHTAAAAEASAFSVESLRDDVVVVRIALPGLEGGLSHRPLHVTVALLGDTSSEEALGARTLDAQQVPPHQPVAFQLQAVLADEPSRRCLEITAEGDLGDVLTLSPGLCVELPARAPAVSSATEVAAIDDETEQDGEPSYRLSDSSAARALSQDGELGSQAGARGCSVGANSPARDLSWLLLAVLPFLASHRRTIAWQPMLSLATLIHVAERSKVVRHPSTRLDYPSGRSSNDDSDSTRRRDRGRRDGQRHRRTLCQRRPRSGASRHRSAQPHGRREEAEERAQPLRAGRPRQGAQGQAGSAVPQEQRKADHSRQYRR